MSRPRSEAVAHYKAGLQHESQAQFKAAENAYRKATRLEPRFVEAQNNLGNALLRQGRIKEATGAFRKALKLQPEHPLLLNNLGNVLQMNGEHDKAIGLLRQAIELAPEYADAHNNLGNALSGKGLHAEASEAYREAVAAAPEQIEIHANLGTSLNRIGQHAEAAECFRAALAIAPNHVPALTGLGLALSQSGASAEAEKAFRQASALAPNDPEPLLGLADLQADLGEIQAAADTYARILAVDPRNVGALSGFTQTTRFKPEHEAQLKFMTSLVSEAGLSARDRISLHAALGKAQEDLKNYERAMKHFKAAAQARKKTFKYSHRDAEKLFDDSMALYNAESIRHYRELGNTSRQPIFILGMPRSGTSLVEQILATHSTVFGAGELPHIPILEEGASQALQNTAEDDTDTIRNTLQTAARDYLAELEQINTEDAARVTDKLPQNFLHIGFIKSALPEAKIIYCQRDPMDNCLSVFKTQFERSYPYSYDLQDLGRYYLLHAKIMEHWQTALPGEIHTVQYETMIDQQESETRRLLAFCELDWEEQCLAFHKTRRRIATASNAQVVKPIYRSSVQAWRRYEKELEPLRRIVAPDT